MSLSSHTNPGMHSGRVAAAAYEVRRTRSSSATGCYMHLTFAKLLAIFIVGSVVGLVVEIVFHAAVFGGYESRAGLVWGPFSPLYGFGAVVLTVVFNYLWKLNGAVLFVISALLGSVLEFATSWGMEFFFGAIAWDYSGTFGNIQGRVNVVFALMWGTLGILWARAALPLIARALDSVDWAMPAIRVGTVFVTVFFAVNIVVTVQALDRESERMLGMPAASQIDQFYDDYFPTAWMDQRFANMSVYGNEGFQKADH